MADKRKTKKRKKRKGTIKVIHIKGKGKRCLKVGKRGFVKCPSNLKGLSGNTTGNMAGSKSGSRKIRRIRIKGKGVRCQKPNGRFTKCPK